METIGDWLLAALELRGWPQAELARRAGLGNSTLSRIISGDRQLGAEAALAIARALGEDPVKVFRLAGILPQEAPAVTEEREILAIFRRLPAGVRRTVATMIRGLAGPGPAPAALTDPAEPYNTDDILIPELLAEFSQVPDEWKETAIAQIAQFRRAAEPPAPRIIGDPESETERNQDAPQL